MTKPKLILLVKSIYGRIYSYPTEPVLQNLLKAKDDVKRDGLIIPAKCFTAYDVATWLPVHCNEIGAELVEDLTELSVNYVIKWEDEKKVYVK